MRDFSCSLHWRATYHCIICLKQPRAASAAGRQCVWFLFPRFGKAFAQAKHLLNCSGEAAENSLDHATGLSDLSNRRYKWQKSADYVLVVSQVSTEPFSHVRHLWNYRVGVG